MTQLLSRLRWPPLFGERDDWCRSAPGRAPGCRVSDGDPLGTGRIPAADLPAADRDAPSRGLTTALPESTRAFFLVGRRAA